jgi:hypothetical protein
MAAPEQHKKAVNLGLIALLFLCGLILFLVLSGKGVDEVDVLKGRVKFTPNIAGPEKAEETSRPELTARQAELEEKIRRLDEQLAARGLGPGMGGSGAGPGDVTQAPVQMNLGGPWQGAQGLYNFTLTQSGSQLALQWFEPMRGLIAVGQGQVHGETVHLNYTTIFGTQGVAQLQASPDGHQLTGGFQDMTTGYQGQLFLTR